MHYLKAQLQPASLFSMRLPYTHQSALTYPLPPPSTVLGIIANALQRAEGRNPVEALQETEATLATATAIAPDNTPIAARSCIVSLITRVQPRGEGKVTDALPRQFAHTHTLTILALSQNADFLHRARNALSRAPVTIGGNESAASPIATSIGQCQPECLETGQPVLTHAYLPRDLLDLSTVDRQHALFWVHESSLNTEDLVAYLFPLTLQGHLYAPAPLQGQLARPAVAYPIDADTILVHGGD